MSSITKILMENTNTIYGRFRQQTETNPDAPAVIEGRRRYTYSELDSMAGRIAALLPPDDRYIGVVMEHGVLMIASLLAVLKSGAAYVPVEPSFPRERIRFIMDECKVNLVLANSRYRRMLKGLPVLALDSAPKGDAPHSEDKSRAADPAYVLYTSGSTGLPKGVVATNANVCHYADAFRNEFGIGRGDRMLQYSVCTFDIFVEEVFATLLSGATLAIPDKKTRDNIGALMQFVADNNVTIISGFPYLLLEMNHLDSIPQSLRLLISGGDVLRAGYIDRLLPHVEIYNTYGPSETTVCASYYRCNGTHALADGTYPIGKAVKGVKIEIRDSDMKPVANGTPGEICISGNGVTLGYIGDREIENRAFVTEEGGRRIYRSGDLGTMLADGTVLFHHRIDSQVMIMGRRVETCEVENVLCRCPEVESGVVRSGTDSRGLAYLVAYLVPGHKCKFSLARIKERMRKFLPDYMLPEFFIPLQSIPLTPNGKVDTRALPPTKKIL